MKWDGSDWSNVGNFSGATIWALGTFDDGGGLALYAGTAPGRGSISKLSGSSWLPLGEGLDDEIVAIANHDDGSGPALYAAGEMTVAGGVPVTGIAKWDGATWAPLGSGLNGERVEAMAEFDDGVGAALYVGGTFGSAGGMPVNRIAKWFGSSWAPLGSGVEGTTTTVGVLALAVHDDGGGSALYAGGIFSTAGGASAKNIARWDGAAWSAVGSGRLGRVEALAVFDEGGGPALYAGGRPGSGTDADRIGKWDGTSWSPLGAGMDDDIYALATFDDGNGPALYAAGDFAMAGGVPASRIAKWDGVGWSPLGSGLNNTVHTLQVFDDGSGPALYAGGLFNRRGRRRREPYRQVGRLGLDAPGFRGLFHCFGPDRLRGRRWPRAHRRRALHGPRLEGRLPRQVGGLSGLRSADVERPHGRSRP